MRKPIIVFQYLGHESLNRSQSRALRSIFNILRINIGDDLLAGLRDERRASVLLAVEASDGVGLVRRSESRGVLARTLGPFYEEPLYASELVTGKHYAVREQLTLKQLVATLRQLATRSTDSQPRT